MKICSVTVWYNPDELCVKNILTYNGYLEKCYIIDNSNSNNSVLASKIKNSVYIPNFENLGIAKALNKGCSIAHNEGFEWCMTMDQDSFWDNKNLMIYINEIKNDKDNAVSFAPLINNPNGEITSFLGDFFRVIFNKKKVNKNIECNVFPNKVITSGNIISLDVCNQIGWFNEDFFIDEVDHEFCYRLILNNYKIRVIKNSIMNHVIGAPKKTIFPRSESHELIRLYYIIRNKLYIKKLYPEFYNKEGYSSEIRKILFENILRFKIRNLYYILQGFIDYKKGKIGKYE